MTNWTRARPTELGWYPARRNGHEGLCRVYGDASGKNEVGRRYDGFPVCDSGPFEYHKRIPSPDELEKMDACVEVLRKRVPEPYLFGDGVHRDVCSDCGRTLPDHFESCPTGTALSALDALREEAARE